MSNEKIDLTELSMDRGEQASEKRRPRSVTRLFSRWVVPILIVAGFGAVIYWAVLPALLTGIDVTVVKVRVQESAVSKSGTPLFRASGWVEPGPTPVYVSSLINGTVKSLNVVEDQWVEQGDVVAVLIDDDARLRLRAAEADLLNKQALLEQARVRLKSAEVDYQKPVQKQLAISRVENDLAEINTLLSEMPEKIVQAEADVDFALKDLKSKREAGTAISRIEVEKALSMHTSAVAKLKELNLRKAGLQKQQEVIHAELNSTKEDLDLNNDAANEFGQAQAAEKVAQSQLELAKVQMDVAKLELSRTRVVSPVAGKVMKLMTSPGGHLSGGPAGEGSHTGSVAVMLYDPRSLQLRVDVRFEDVRRVVPGQSVLIESSALATPLHGKVLRMNPVADIQKNTLEVKVSVADAPDALKPAMLMNVTFLSPESEADTDPSASFAIFVPDKLVKREADATYIWVVDPATNTAKRQAVVVDSLVVDEWVEVLKGLNISSQIIETTSAALSDGDSISISGSAR